MDELYYFLMDELKDITLDIEDPSMAAHNICILLSVDGFPVPETFFRLYIAPVNVDYEILMNALAYFTGAGILEVTCDCDSSSKLLCDVHSITNTDFYHCGMKDACEGSDKVAAIYQHIGTLREELMNVD